jgi:hypothetical protein
LLASDDAAAVDFVEEISSILSTAASQAKVDALSKSVSNDFASALQHVVGLE